MPEIPSPSLLPQLDQILDMKDVASILEIDKNDDGTLICPACGRVLRTIGRSLVCENNDCPFQRGSMVSMAASMYHGDYTKALLWCAKKAGLSVTTAGGLFEDPAIIADRSRLKIEAEMHSFFRSCSNGGRSMTPEETAVSAWMERNGVASKHFRRSACVVTNGGLQRIASLIESMHALDGRPITLDRLSSAPEARLAVLLHMRDWHTIGMLTILDPTNPDKPVCWPVNPGRMNFYGLMDMHPQCQKVLLALTTSVTMVCNNTLEVTDRSGFCLSCNLYGREPEWGWVPQNAIFCYSDKLDGTEVGAVGALNLVAPLRGVYEDERAMLNNELTAGWSDFTAEVTIKMLRESDSALSSEVHDILNSSGLSREEQEHVVSRWAAAGLGVAVAQWRAASHDVMVLQQDGSSLYSTPSGFYLRKGGGASRKWLTNFTVEPEGSVITQDGRTFHRLRVDFSGKTGRVSIPAEKLFSWQDLEKAAYSVDPDDTLPVVTDRKNISWVSEHLKNRLATLPVESGIDFLGWNTERTFFTFPDSRHHANGVRHNYSFVPGSHKFLEMYGTPTEADGHPEGTELHQGWVQLVSWCAGMLGLAFNNQKQIHIYLNPGESVDNLLGFFKMVFGQQQWWSAADRHNLPDTKLCMRGYPYLVSCEDVVVTDNPVILINSKGDRWSAGGEAPAACVTALHAVIAGMLNSKTSIPRCDVRSASMSYRLSAYGSNLLRRYFKQDWPEPSSPTPVLDGVIDRAVKNGGLKTVAVQHLTRRTIRIACPEPSIERLVFEVQSLIRKPVTINAGSVEMDALDGLVLLENHTGAIPDLTYDRGDLPSAV